MVDDGFLFEDQDTATSPWWADFPWIKANQLHHHSITVRSTSVHAAMQHYYLEEVGATHVLPMVLYGNNGDGKREFNGLATLYDTHNPEKAQIAPNVLPVGEHKERSTSIWLIAAGLRTVHMASDDGQPSHLGLNWCSLVVRDWRFIARLAHIDHSNFDDIPNWLNAAIHAIPGTSFRDTRAVFWMNQDVRRLVQPLLGPSGKYRSIPVRTVDAIRNDESPLT